MRSCLVAVVVTVGCLACEQGGDTAAGLRGETRDSAGVLIVENARPTEGSRLGWRIGPEPTVSIGVLEGEGPYMLHWAADATRLTDGRILVANGGTHELRVFDGDGRHLDSWGREGEGPSDFTSLVQVGTWPGDSIVAWFTGAAGMAVYDGQGRFGRTFVLRSQEAVNWLRPRPVDVRGDGSILSVRDMEDLDSAIVEVWDGGGTLSASMGAHPAEEILVTADEQGTRTLTHIAYGRQLVTGLWGDLVVASPTSRYEIRAFGGDGNLDRIVRRDHVLRTPTEADREPYVEEAMTPYLETPGLPEPLVEQARRHFGTVPLAQYFPAFSSVLGDATGHLWVEEYKYPRDDRPSVLWTVFNPDGRALGLAETPEGLEIYEIGEDYILGRVKDELGVESIQLWPLERSR